MATTRKSARGKASSSTDISSNAGTTAVKASKRVTARARNLDSSPRSAPRGQAGKKRPVADRLDDLGVGPESITDSTTQASPSKRARTAIDPVGSVSPPGPPEERRLRRFRDHPPRTYLERMERLRTTRVMVCETKVVGTEEVPEFSFDVIGSTGNLYKTTIKQLPHCNCPDGLLGNQCKHICYVLHYVLRAPEHLRYQLAFLSSELREIYKAHPLGLLRPGELSPADKWNNRKPIEGNCPICYQDMTGSTEEIVWCRGSCGNNVHKECFKLWSAASSNLNSSESFEPTPIRCVYCRSVWVPNISEMNPHTIHLNTMRSVPGSSYPNYAAELGMSSERDWSVYSPFSTAQPFSSWQPYE